ncbi:phosphoribosylanthranilate isomerase [Paenibacillus radicis (ex Xue et al. 2023)]|uniref:N-(5'-phosphoribosyl)anthranilate isomerase n=1 Tax=Paenibacillus radicis (ex Xue et al. 2023) TaxID=2972489 RepID=A0ABT1YP33_9BACL|nr:phosphoribosylanthranilate isomerase [Paenibacillus radicis (ex Xue et al. 2023)]MCR8634475.1 phosphoribosylanthranilate isomerase [Paenibacillus radicis (ex Xue et al. 2023)]
MSTVKICGLQQPDMVKAILHLPIDYIGFLFAKSKRQVTAQQAGEMIQLVVDQRLSGEQVPLTVGVFVNPDSEELAGVMAEAPLDVIQLHGQESPEYCRKVKNAFPGVQVWKVVSVTQAQLQPMDKKSASESSLSDDSVGHGNADAAVAALLNPYKDTIDGILLDTFDPVYGGGSGKTFAWDSIPPYQAWCRDAGIPLLVAGGLQADNVTSLIDGFSPDGVDVSSGVETDGKKDVNKIISFVERVKHRV